jgi:hypothetical protein
MNEHLAQDAIEAVKHLCEALSLDRATVEDIAARLGSTLSGEAMSVQVRPSSPAFKTARLVRAVGKNEVAHAELSVSQPGTLSVRDLKAAFGAYRTLPRIHPNQPSRVIFSVDESGLAHVCAVIAEVDPGEGLLDDGQVTGLTVRRDIRLS